MKRNYKQWFFTFCCLGLLVLNACGSDNSNFKNSDDEEFVEDAHSNDPDQNVNDPDQNEDGEIEEHWECTVNDFSNCPLGANCIAGVCVGGFPTGGECQSSADCPNDENICVNRVCM